MHTDDTSDPLPVSPPVEAPPSPPGPERFRFTGTASEYFGIWIVNLFLTVVTLGIYSAWAKVRKKRYLYGNTWLAGTNFEYHGQPMAILRGRIIAFVAFGVYTVAGGFSPRVAAWVLLALLVAFPWLLARSFAFNAANSSYRNIRFHFAGRWRDVLGVTLPLLVLPLSVLLGPDVDPRVPPTEFSGIFALLIGPIVVSLFYPYIVGKLRRLMVSHSSFGTAPFACDASVRTIYGYYFMAGLIASGVGMVAGFVATLVSALSVTLVFAAGAIGYVFVFAVAMGYTQAKVGNHVLNRTTGPNGERFESTLSAGRLGTLYLGNALAIMVTAGLAVPWAVIRIQRYRADCLALHCPAGLDGFTAGPQQRVTATGEEMGSMFDVDFAL